MGTLFKIIIGLVLVVVIAVVVVVLNLDRGIKAAVEEMGPEYTQSKITLDKVSISLKTGEGALYGLVVGNPAGFKTEQAFSLGEISVDIDTSTVTSNVIVINQIRIVRPEITYESGAGGSNIDQLQRNVEQAVGSSSGSSASSSGEASSESIKLIIKSLQITGGQIHYSNALLGGKTIDVALPDITLTNIGGKSGGVTGAEVLKQVLSAINKKATSAIAGSGAIDDLKGQLEGKAKQAVSDKLKGLFGRD